MNGNRIAAMKRQQKEARRLMATGVIAWDEISVAPKCAQEAVESLPREIVQNYRSFGGKLFIIGDDFRQVLQIGEHAQHDDFVSFRGFVKVKTMSNVLFELTQRQQRLRKSENDEQRSDRLNENAQCQQKRRLNESSERSARCTADVIKENGRMKERSTVMNVCATTHNDIVVVGMPALICQV
ncbi:hypothetical protein NECAME_08794 [Necator americanus]|uniref:ATP-dependent DNA helicase n=1 Tax=Necator americanus TaxID=51031 RepID=W2TG65_NECAM|nr:hypothetical protein NECAME_08794 [Necator americanus]ETN81040.1 hypothetical protein NECAME_08794 [Necator americanus]